MSDILAVFGILLILGVAYPGLLLMNWLALPTLTGRAREQVARHPVRSFWSGLGFSLLLVLPVVIFLSLPSGLSKGMGWILILGAVSFSSIGAAGLVLELSTRLDMSAPGEPPIGKPTSKLGSFVRAAVVLELASVFPLIGWLVVLPLATLTCFGAAIVAVISRKRTAAAPSPILEPDLNEREVASHDAIAS